MTDYEPLVASGGWCAPVAPMYDLFLDPWDTPDENPFPVMHPFRSLRRAQLFLRRAEERAAAARRRLRDALWVLRNGMPYRGDGWDDD